MADTPGYMWGSRAARGDPVWLRHGDCLRSHFIAIRSERFRVGGDDGMKKTAIAVCTGVLLLCAVGSASPAQAPRVLFLMPSMGVMGMELFPILERFEDLGIAYDVAAGETGPYLFWEDSNECRYSDTLGGYTYDVTLAIEDARLEWYAAVVVAPGYAHSFWFEPGASRAEELVLEAAAMGMPIGGMSYGVWVLLGCGILDGRTACNWPHPQGILSPETHWNGFLSNFAVEFLPGCVLTDHGVDGQSPVVTANYKCPQGFADAVAAVLLSADEP